MADALAEGRWDAEDAGTWHERALRLQRLVDQPRNALGHSRESLRVNLRRTSARSAPGKDYDDAVVVLDYAAVHTAGVTRAVLEAAAEDKAAARPRPALARRYADFLRQTAHTLHLYSHSRFGHQSDRELRQAVEELHETLHALRRQLARPGTDDPDEVAAYGTSDPGSAPGRPARHRTGVTRHRVRVLTSIHRHEAARRDCRPA